MQPAASQISGLGLQKGLGFQKGTPWTLVCSLRVVVRTLVCSLRVVFPGGFFACLFFTGMFPGGSKM